MNKEPLDIIMVAWKRPDFTSRSLKAILENTKYPFRLHLIINEAPVINGMLIVGMDDVYESVTMLKDNIGLEPAKNLGLFFAKSKYFISTDNDILPMKPNEKGDWLTQLVDLAEQNPDYGAISCRTQVMIGTGNIFSGKEEQDIVEFPHPGGSLRIMRTDLVKKLGGWRNDMKGRGSEEKYIGEKIREAGYKTGFATKVKCYHLFGEKNWGYGDMPIEEHGHTKIWHPALDGDSPEKLKEYE